MRLAEKLTTTVQGTLNVPIDQVLISDGHTYIAGEVTVHSSEVTDDRSLLVRFALSREHMLPNEAHTYTDSENDQLLIPFY